MKKKKLAFTLIELLAVIIVLAIIALIATPIIFNVIENAKLKSLENSCYGVIDAVKTNYAENLLNSEDGTVSLSGNITDLTVAGEQPIQGTWEIDNTSDSTNRGIKIEDVKFASMNDYTCTNVNSDGTINNKVTCTKDGGGGNTTSLYTDNSGANIPVLYNNMVPIKYENSKWVYADTTQEWYDYDSQEWANAVVLNTGTTKSIGDEITEDDIALWYVWIPRYKYTIFNGNNRSASEQLINVTFESGTTTTGTVICVDNTDGSETCTDSTNGSVINGTSTYTHPAFTFGSTSLTGFWVGKFEVSGSKSAITIKPNVSSLGSGTVSSFFTAIKNIETTYEVSNADSHMIKNMEWGAVAYLKQSKYGLGTTDIGINNYIDSSYIPMTGCGAASGSSSSSTCNAYDTTIGMLASTTGNIYGVYDMSDGSSELVMGNMLNSSNAFYSSGSGFSTALDSKYYDVYKYDSSSYTTHARGKLGDATKETLSTFGSYTGGWYSGSTFFPYASLPWFVRGSESRSGSSAGIFIFGLSNGGNATTRAVLTAQ